MDVDPDIANWVLEFFLRQPLDEGMLKSLLWILPIRDDNPKLKKLLLLKKLELEVSSDKISEAPLDLFEQLAELERQNGSEGLSDAMKRAYCAVAVECTVKTLVDNDFGDRFCRLNYIVAVKRVWRGRIGGLEKKGEKLGLDSEDLWVWKKEIEDAVLDDDAYEKIKKKSPRVNAVDAIVSYLKEEREKMGPSFLESVAARERGDESMEGVLEMGGVDQVAGKEELSHGTELTEDHGNQVEIRKGKIHLRNKLVGVRRSRRLVIGGSKGAKIVDSDEMETMPSNINYNVPHCAEVNRVKESLADAVVDKAGDARVDKTIDGDMSSTPKPSLMERNFTAHMDEWDDSIDQSEQGQGPTHQRGTLLLPCPVMLNASPLQRHIDFHSGRRKRKFWSSLEENTLREGVQKYGVGNWKCILTAYRETFENRNEVDLKDKWRNMAGRRT